MLKIHIFINHLVEHGTSFIGGHCTEMGHNIFIGDLGGGGWRLGNDCLLAGYGDSIVVFDFRNPSGRLGPPKWFLSALGRAMTNFPTVEASVFGHQFSSLFVRQRSSEAGHTQGRIHRYRPLLTGAELVSGARWRSSWGWESIWMGTE